MLVAGVSHEMLLPIAIWELQCFGGKSTTKSLGEESFVTSLFLVVTFDFSFFMIRLLSWSLII